MREDGRKKKKNLLFFHFSFPSIEDLRFLILFYYFLHLSSHNFGFPNELPRNLANSSKPSRGRSSREDLNTNIKSAVENELGTER